MRITHKMVSHNINHNLQNNLQRLERYGDQLSTGKKFTRPSQEPVGVGRVMSYSASIDRNEQFRLNMNQSKSWLDNTEGGLQNGLDVLQRIRELCIYGANDSLTAEDRRAIAPEVLEFTEHMIGVANTESNGLYIFGGHQTFNSPYVRENMYHVEVNEDSGIRYGEENEAEIYDLIAEGMQNGDYRLDQVREELEADQEAAVSFSGQYLQGSAMNIIGNDNFEETAGEINSGVMVKAEPQEGSDLTIDYDNNNFIENEPDQGFALKLNYDGETEQWNYVESVSGEEGTVDENGVLEPEGGNESVLGDDFRIDMDQLAGAEDGDSVTVASGFSASVQLEVTGVDESTGEVTYHYNSHQYALDGTYENHEGSFTLTYGEEGEESQTVNLGDIEFNIEGLDQLDALDAGDLKMGDKAILNFKPSGEEGVTYDQAHLSGEHRGGGSGITYVFAEEALNDSDIELHYQSLDTFDRSPNKGEVHDGSISLSYNQFADTGEEAALTFSYDSEGFPVYYGDDKERSQDISPHQQVIMNLSGKKVFGENEEVFEAVFEVYNALMNDDREALGGEALDKMDKSVDHFLEQLAQVGARSNRVEAMYDTLFSENISLREIRSEIEDIDLAYVITEFTMQENAYHAALSTAQKMLQPTLVDYMR